MWTGARLIWTVGVILRPLVQCYRHLAYINYKIKICNVSQPIYVHFLFQIVCFGKQRQHIHRKLTSFRERIAR